MQIIMRFPNGKSKALTLSYDDGIVQDIRLATFMDKYGIRGTFNVNTGLFPNEDAIIPKEQLRKRLKRSEIIDFFEKSPHEVAVHTLMHPPLDEVPFSSAISEIFEDCRNLEAMFKKPIRGIAYPYHGYTDDILDALKKAHFLYGRTVNSSYNFDLPENPLTLWPTCHHDDPKLMELAKKFIETNIDKDTPYELQPYLFYVWGHSYEFDDHQNWEVIENFIKYVSGKKDVWYATNSEIMTYIEKWKQIEFSLDRQYAQNPTDTDLYMLYDGRYECIKSGETKDFSFI